MLCYMFSNISKMEIQQYLLVNAGNHENAVNSDVDSHHSHFRGSYLSAYKVDTLLSIDYEGDALDDGDLPSVVTRRFNLGQSHSLPSTPRIS
ncbi:hypothetical protein C8R42DRAFT_89357 [Lentinula raphanica]|nr:hypothetical protein C8R42DRAFT_89357 [Lentinula raphanica]